MALLLIRAGVVLFIVAVLWLLAELKYAPTIDDALDVWPDDSAEPDELDFLVDQPACCDYHVLEHSWQMTE